MRVLIDADAYIAIYGAGDSNHTKSVAGLKSAKAQGAKFFTTWDVVDEVTTKLSYKISKEAADKFLLDLAVSGTTIIYPDEDLLGKVVDLFTEIKSKNVSFTDCGNMVVYQAYSVDRIFSFDKIYSKQGLRILN